MTIRMNTALRTRRWDCIFNSAAGINFDSGVLELRTGGQPATADAALTGIVTDTIALPADAMAAAAGGTIAKAGVWQTPASDATGLPGYFTMRDATATYRMDGSAAVPVAGAGTVSAAAGTLTFSQTQAGIVQVGSRITVGSIAYTVLTFNGTTSATVTGNPTFAASAFATTDPADMQLDGTITGGQLFQVPTFSLTDPA